MLGQRRRNEAYENCTIPLSPWMGQGFLTLKNKIMGLGHLPLPNRHNDNFHAAVFNNTWGHFSPHKNVSYKGIVRFTLTDHSHYGCQPIIITYNFPNLEGPYIHDELFNDICDWNKEGLEKGCIYEINLTFRNYRFYYSKIKKLL